MMIFSCSYLIVLQYFVKWRSVAVGIVASAPAIGMFAMTQFTELILSKFGWQGALLGFGFFHVVVALCSTVFVPLEDTKGKTNNENKVGEIKYQQERLTNDAPLYRNHSFLIMLSSFAVVMFAYFVPTVHIVSTFRYFVFNLALYFMTSL